MKHIVAAIVVAILATFTGCDTPAGSDRGDSAGNNQPGSACNVVAGGGEPAAQISDGQYLYDVYAELQDADCNPVTVGGQPLHFHITGSINGEPATYLDSADAEKDVDSPHHVTAFVKPRGVPHDMIVIVNVRKEHFTRLANETDAEFVHCAILRDRQTITVARGSRDRVTATTLIQAPWAQAHCHFTVGVG